MNMLNIDHILETLNRHGVEYLLLGGVNFLLQHEPVLTFDVDVWIRDTAENRTRCVTALIALKAEWGTSTATWLPVAQMDGDWLSRQPLFCLTTAVGPLDVFRSVRGLADWDAATRRSVVVTTTGGVSCRGLCDADMLQCQQALPENERRLDRMRTLQRCLEERTHG